MQLTDEQVKVRDCEGHLVVVTARAGSGKTATMVERIRAEIQRGTNPRDIAAITYTVTAARELQHRLGCELGHCGTLHSYVMRCLQVDPATVADEGEVAEIAKQACAALNIRGLTNKGLLRAMEDVVDHPGDIGVALRYVRAELKTRGRTTFALVLREFHEALMRGEHRRAWALLVVDEAQDTAPIDAEIFEAMDAAKRIFIGDPFQAIFGFRGCTDRFFRKMARKATDYLPLSTTFRCRRAICDAANALLNGGPVCPMRTVHKDGDGYIEALRYPNEAEELKGILAWAKQCNGTRAVLCRYNADVARVGAWLLANGMKVRMRRAEPDRLLVAALRLLASKRDANLLAALRGELGERAAKLPIVADADAVELLARSVRDGQGTVPAALTMLGIPAEVAADAAPDGVPVFAALEAALRGEPPGEADTTEVVVGTVHSAKGREFDDVLVASCYAPGKTADTDEEARIFYVAITRARNTATVTFADRRIDPRTMAELAGVPSPFIATANIETTEDTHATA